MVATLEQNQIIEITSFDRAGKKKLRRVRVSELADNGNGTAEVVGVNMQSENPIPYTLKMTSAERIERQPGARFWKPYVDTGTGEE